MEIHQQHLCRDHDDMDAPWNETGAGHCGKCGQHDYLGDEGLCSVCEANEPDDTQVYRIIAAMAAYMPEDRAAKAIEFVCQVEGLDPDKVYEKYDRIKST